MLDHKRLKNRILPVLLSAVLLSSSLPVFGEDLLTDGSDNYTQPVYAEESGAEEVYQEPAGPETAEEDDLGDLSSGTEEEEASDQAAQDTGNAQAEEVFAEEVLPAEELGADPAEELLVSGTADELLGSQEATPTGIRYIKGRPLTEEERAEQLAPFAGLTDLGEMPEVNSDMNAGTPFVGGDNFPSVYDCRELCTTPQKQPSNYGNCWAFSSASMMETSLLAQNLGRRDLSEEHLSYFWANRQEDPLGNTKNDRNIKSGDYRTGGNTWLAALFLASWSGMALDYRYPTSYTKWGDYSSDALKKAAYDTEAYMIDAVFSEYSITRVKQLVQQYRSASIFINMKTTYYNPDTAAFCSPKASVDHAVTIVGWDDTYSKENFLAKCNVTQDGAWIVKNSWGPSWGEGGYFYVSYQDQSLRTVTCLTGTANPTYPNNYFYDGSTSLSSVSFENGEAFAVVYQAKAGNGLGERLGEVVTTSENDNARYAIQVYVGLSDPSDPVSGTPAFSSPYRYTQTYAGVDTIPLPAEVEIAPGTYYSVVVTNIGGTIEFYTEYNDSSDSWYRTSASILANQGFYYDGEDWADCKSQGFTPRIKAHTRTMDYAPSISAAADSYQLLQGQSVSVVPTMSPSSYGSYGYTYKSSDTGVATVSSKGVVTAVYGGQAQITITSKAAPYLQTSCTVTVTPAAPTSVKASQASYNSIKVSWNAVSGATGYAVYCSENGGEFVLLGNTTGTTYTDKDAASKGRYIAPKTRYRYKVCTYRNNSGKSWYSAMSDESNEVLADLAKPTVTVRTFNTLYSTVAWTKVTGAAGYVVYEKIGSGAWTRWKTITNGKTFKLTRSNVTALTKYQYKVLPFRTIQEKRYYGTGTESIVITASPKKQTIKSLSKVSAGVKITWTAQKKCNGYLIYRKTGSGSYKKIKTITNSSTAVFTDTGAKKSGTYTYYIKAYVKEPYGNVYSTFTTKTIKK